MANLEWLYYDLLLNGENISVIWEKTEIFERQKRKWAIVCL
jgi:hypothetical protein